MKTRVGKIGVMALIAASPTLPAACATAGEYLTIEVEEELPADLRAAFNQVIAPSTLETAISQGIDRAITIDALCTIISCSESERAILANTAVAAVGPSAAPHVPGAVAGPPVGVGNSPDVAAIDGDLAAPPGSEAYRWGVNKRFLALTDSAGSGTKGQSFIVIDPTDPSYAAYENPLPASRGAKADAVAIPLSPDFLKNSIASGRAVPATAPESIGAAELSAVWLDSGENFALSVLEGDIERHGKSRRQFQIASLATPEDIELLKSLTEKYHVSLSITDEPANEFELAGLENDVTFEADADRCRAASESWPMDVRQVADTMAFDREVLSNVGVIHIRRSNILVVDTGLGRLLAQSPLYRKFLYVDASELLYADTYYRNLSFDDASLTCLDADRNYSTSDAYGFAPQDPQARCQDTTPLQRVMPVEKLAGDRLPPYSPAHGSFVGVLAAGGPDLVESVKGLDQFLGLTFARITRFPESDYQSVKTEVADLKDALSFAISRNVDVINMSLRVAGANDRSELVRALEGFSGTIVAAAGNYPEEITEASSSFPAAITGPLRKNENLIVVAAIQADQAEPLWSKSAWSGSLIDIGAPGVDITSMDHLGQRVCMSGTSAAAPLVTFTAAILRALGINTPQEVRRRILATARVNDQLKHQIEGGRVLDIPNALDVFVDQISLKGVASPIRALLREEDGDGVPVMLQLCEPKEALLKPGGGFIDPAVLVYWQRRGANRAELWHRLGDTISSQGALCRPPAESKVTYTNLSTGKVVATPLTEIDRIVPSPFRNALTVTGELILGR